MYKSIFTCVLLLTVIAPAWAANDSVPKQKSVDIDEIVVTGTRSETDSRRLSSTVSVLSRDVIEKSYESSLLPLLSAHVPDCLYKSRPAGIWRLDRCCRRHDPAWYRQQSHLGLLVLIDGHPQYMGLMGHPIADAYQTVLAEKVEVVRGPASVIYGSNAMGGVINIVTRKPKRGRKPICEAATARSTHRPTKSPIRPVSGASAAPYRHSTTAPTAIAATWDLNRWEASSSFPTKCRPPGRWVPT